MHLRGSAVGIDGAVLVDIFVFAVVKVQDHIQKRLGLFLLRIDVVVVIVIFAKVLCHPNV